VGKNADGSTTGAGGVASLAAAFFGAAGAGAGAASTPQPGSQPQLGSQPLSQPQLGSAQPHLLQRLPKIRSSNETRQRFLHGLAAQPVSQPQLGSLPQEGSQPLSQPQLGSAQQLFLHLLRSMSNSGVRQRFLHGLAAQPVSQPQLGSLPQEGSQPLSQPQLGSSLQLFEQLWQRSNSRMLFSLQTRHRIASMMGVSQLALFAAQPSHPFSTPQQVSAVSQQLTAQPHPS